MAMQSREHARPGKWFNMELKRQCDKAWLLFAIAGAGMFAYAVAFLFILWEVQWPEYIAASLMALGVFFLGRISALEAADNLLDDILITERKKWTGTNRLN